MQSTNFIKNRFIFLDYLRAISCLLVIFDHLFLSFIEEYQWICDTLTGKIENTQRIGQSPYLNHLHDMREKISHYAISVLYKNIDLAQVAVGLFFILSGFLMASSVRKYGMKQFLAMRFMRIYPAFWISLAITISCCYFYTGTIFKLKNTIENFTLLFPIKGILLTNYWTLVMEVYFYLLMSFLCWWRGKIRNITWESLLVMIIMLSIILTITPMMHGTFLWWILERIPLFFIGSLVNIAIFRREVLWCLILIGYVSLFLWHITIMITVAIFAIFLALDICVNTEKKPSNLILRAGDATMKWLAKISYYLYLLHAPLGWIILIAVYIGTNSLVISYIACFTAILLLSWISSIFLDKLSHYTKT